MNADYPANPAAPGSHPFPGVTQAAPQGAGGPESPVPAAPRTQSSQGSGGATHPDAPAVPAPSPYASPAGSTGAAGQRTTPSTQHTTTEHSSTQHTTRQHSTTPSGAAPVAPVRRASLRSGTQPLSTSDADAKDDATPAPKKFGLFGKKSEGAEPSGTTSTLRRKGGPRKVRAMMTAIDPWSAMKMSFLTAIAAGIALVVAVSVVWGVLNRMGAFAAIQEQVTTLFALDSETKILAYFEYSKVMSGTILIAVFNVVLMTALGTIGALIYNVIAKLVGGVYVTLSDD